MSDRTVEYDLKFLIAVLNWAAKSRYERGRLLLDSNPLKGLRTHTEKNPTWVVLAEEEYRALLEVSRRVDWRFHVALVLAHETGHRIGAIPQLQWCDIDFEGGTILWRAEHDKSGYERITPVTAETLDALKEVWSPNALAGRLRCCPRPGIHWRVSVPLGCTLGGRRPRFLRSWNRCPAGAGTRFGGSSRATYGPAAEGALRTWGLEDGQDGASVLPETRCGTASEGSGRPAPRSRRKSGIAGVKQREFGPS